MTKMSLQTESNSIHEDHAALLLSNQTCCEDAIFSASLHILCQVCVVVFKSEMVYQFPANKMPLVLASESQERTRSNFVLVLLQMDKNIVSAIKVNADYSRSSK